MNPATIRTASPEGALAKAALDALLTIASGRASYAGARDLARCAAATIEAMARQSCPQDEGHTPTPWFVAYDDHNGQAVISGEHTEICTCWHHSVGGIEKQMRANAALIVRAVNAYAQGIAAQSDETPQEVRPEGQEPGGEAMRPSHTGNLT